MTHSGRSGREGTELKVYTPSAQAFYTAQTNKTGEEEPLFYSIPSFLKETEKKKKKKSQLVIHDLNQFMRCHAMPSSPRV
jgi:hypothetical protein